MKLSISLEGLPVGQVNETPVTETERSAIVLQLQGRAAHLTLESDNTLTVLEAVEHFVTGELAKLPYVDEYDCFRTHGERPKLPLHAEVYAEARGLEEELTNLKRQHARELADVREKLENETNLGKQALDRIDTLRSQLEMRRKLSDLLAGVVDDLVKDRASTGRRWPNGLRKRVKNALDTWRTLRG